MMTKKELRYRQIIEHQLSGIYNHMCTNLLGWIEEGTTIDEERLTRDQREAVGNVMAIEAEWVLDPEQREAMSLVQWEE